MTLFMTLPSSGRSSITFSESLIQGGYNYCYGVSAGDLDGDGHVDLVTPNIFGYGSSSDVYWFKNDGAGHFQQRTLDQGEPGALERNAIGDINRDGKPDVVIIDWSLGRVLWYGNNNPGAGVWDQHVVTTSASHAYDLSLADLNGDDLLDIAISGHASNQITWYRNPGATGWNQPWSQFVIDNSMIEARTIRTADFNGDGRMDLLATAAGSQNVPVPSPPSVHNGKTVWYENTGVAGTWTKHVIDEQSRAPIHGQSLDMDLDGDPDVVMAFGMRTDLLPSPAQGHEIAWYEKLNTAGTSWTKHTVGSLPYAFEAVGSDLDLDGDVDIAATSWSLGDKVVWFENQGDPRDPWEMHVLKDNFKAANQVIIADLTHDGLKDIIATADDGSRRVVGANELRWWKSSNLVPGWAFDGSGDWNVVGNWAHGVPNAVGAEANFGTFITSGQTVYTNTAVTVGTLKFDNANTYLLAGLGSLTVQVSSGAGSVSVLQGDHKINLPLFFASNTNITIASGATLTIADPMTIRAGKTVTKSGNLIIQAPLTIEAGATFTLAGPGAATLLGAPSLAAGAVVNVQNNTMTVDYRGQTSPAETIRTQLLSGYNNGLWNGEGINTSSAIARETGLGWRDNPASQSISVKYTYYGDIDLSGTVDSTDFNAFVAGYGLTGGAIWAQGDFDYDQKVSTLDFNYLAGNFGKAAIPSAALGAVVPEPMGLSVMGVAVLGLLSRRRGAAM